MRARLNPWTKPHYRSCLAQLKRAAKGGRVRLDVPWKDLSPDEQQFVVAGQADAVEGDDESEGFDGVRGFFRRLERKKYKVHVRVFLSRYRGYLTCPECNGTRLRREARDVRVGGRTIDAVCGLTVRNAATFFEELALGEKDAVVADKILREIRRRWAS
jgi:excinuclease ABC subunit A